jgi:hypothetical protein
MAIVLILSMGDITAYCAQALHPCQTGRDHVGKTRNGKRSTWYHITANTSLIASSFQQINLVVHPISSTDRVVAAASTQRSPDSGAALLSAAAAAAGGSTEFRAR